MFKKFIISALMVLGGLYSLPENHAQVIGEPGVHVEYQAAEVNLAEGMVFPHKAGGQILGAGTGPAIKNNNLKGNTTQFYWQGATGPMMKVYGSHYLIDGFSLHGQYWQNKELVGEKADIGLLIAKKPGLGTGKHDIRRLYISNTKVGMQFGETENDHNCDECQIGFYQSHQNDVGVKLKNSMAMGHHFERYIGKGTPIHFQIDAGGKVSVDKVFIVKGTLLHFSDDNENKFTGPNNGSFWFRSLHADQQSGSDMRYLVMERSLPLHVTFDGGHISYDKYYQEDARLCVAKGPAVIILRDINNLQRGMLGGTPEDRPGNWPDTHPTYIVENCRLAGMSSVAELAAPGSTITIIGRSNIRHWTNELLPDGTFHIVPPEPFTPGGTN